MERADGAPGNVDVRLAILAPGAAAQPLVYGGGNGYGGAGAADLAWMVVGRAMGMAACGLAIGSLGTVFLTRAVESLLFGVTRFDVASYAAAGSARRAWRRRALVWWPEVVYMWASRSA